MSCNFGTQSATHEHGLVCLLKQQHPSKGVQMECTSQKPTQLTLQRTCHCAGAWLHPDIEMERSFTGLLVSLPATLELRCFLARRSAIL